MTASRAIPPAVIAALALGACSKPATQTATTAPPLVATTAPAAATAPAVTPGAAPIGAAPASDGAAASPPASGYSCSFPGPDGRAILARFTLEGTGAHDDQGLPFSVLTNSPTALVLAHARDDATVAPAGDVGAYVVAIDRRTLAMVQSTVGLSGPGVTRRGHCIAG